MKAFFFLLLLFFVGNISAQSESIVYLKNGSQIRGQIINSGSEEKLQIAMSEGTLLLFDKSDVEYIDHKPNQFLSFSNGYQVISKGTYKNFAFNFMSGKQAGNWQDGKRTGVGFQYSMGHQFFTGLGVGAGVGFDWHEQVMMPVYFEVTGVLPHQIFKLEKEGRKGYPIPFVYNIQFGHNFQVEEFISDPSEFEDIKGGWMFYPSFGLVFPGRNGKSLKMDFGYKIQRYTRTYDYDWWFDYDQKDKVTLKSMSLRVGLNF